MKLAAAMRFAGSGWLKASLICASDLSRAHSLASFAWSSRSGSAKTSSARARRSTLRRRAASVRLLGNRRKARRIFWRGMVEMSCMSFLAFLPAMVLRREPAKSTRETECDKCHVEVGYVEELEAEVRRLGAALEHACTRNEELVIERDSARRRLDQQSRMLEGLMQARLNSQECVCAFRSLYVAQQALANPFDVAHIAECTGGGRARYLRMAEIIRSSP